VAQLTRRPRGRVKSGRLGHPPDKVGASVGDFAGLVKPPANWSDGINSSSPASTPWAAAAASNKAGMQQTRNG
jgi:hypothetical protein